MKRALKKGLPEIFNSDQGSQFTTKAFVSELKNAGIQISMDGRGRAFDNIIIERFWRSAKYEEIYSKKKQRFQNFQKVCTITYN
ncbi:MAG: transposase family protein [Anaerolineaceae bacterium]|nr:transposase family protein [Anaerolineaceae bacterium]